MGLAVPHSFIQTHSLVRIQLLGLVVRGTSRPALELVSEGLLSGLSVPSGTLVCLSYAEGMKVTHSDLDAGICCPLSRLKLRLGLMSNLCIINDTGVTRVKSS